MITSLDELAAECIDETARAQVREAIQCYQSGAYRAAIVTAYVAVCFDLIQKLKALAASGDAEANLVVTDLESLQEQNDRGDPVAIKGLLTFERVLLETFRDKFDFFGRNEFDELDRLRTDRNRCAHPTFLKNSLPFVPSAELARLHIRNALVLVLTQRPKQGKAALDSLQTLVLSPYFPKEVPDAVARLKGSEIQNAKLTLIRAFVDLLCFGWPNTSSPLHRESAAYIALGAIIELHRNDALPRLIQNVNKLLMETEDYAIRFGCFLALRNVEVGEAIDDAGRPVLKSWLKEPTGTKRGNAVKKALSIEWLRDDALDALSKLVSTDFGEITGEIPSEVITASAELYSRAKDWTQANDCASRFAISFASRYSESDLDIIFSEVAAGQADLRGSHGFTQFIEALLSQDGARREQVTALIKRHELETCLPKADSGGED